MKRNRYSALQGGISAGLTTRPCCVCLSQNRMWRKNRSVSKRGGCIGVDLNRNFDANWCSKSSSHTTVQFKGGKCEGGKKDPVRFCKEQLSRNDDSVSQNNYWLLLFLIQIETSPKIMTNKLKCKTFSKWRLADLEIITRWIFST